MLSYENTPPDSLKSIGKSTVPHNSSDENITEANNSLPETEHQLISSSVEVPNFSIRDFVFSARSKDIGTNWPFPDKHLKLCLKHGVKEVLPPFESKICKRKPYSTIVLGKNSLVEDGIISRIRVEEPSERVDNLTVHSSGDAGLTQKAKAHHHLDIAFDKYNKDSDFISSDTSNSLVHPSRSGGTFKHHRFPKTSAKTSSSKCKLVVKFGSPSVHRPNEESMSHKNNLSDSPASKVCPVCKTFSSSSNTTLNAHIDQCLFVETTSEGVADSRTGTKCKVKPRKMRSMVDIYKTALVCTIEDLDRRNGSNWATDLISPARNTGVISGQGNKKKISLPTEPDREDNDDGGVYIDSNGRKLRILSKMDSFSSAVTTKEDNVARKPQLNKVLSSSSRKRHGTKHHKYLKLAVSNKKRLAPKEDSSQVLRTQKPSADSVLYNDPRDNDEVDTFRDEGTRQHPRHIFHGIQRSTQKSRLGDFDVENSSSHDSYRNSACLSERYERIKSPDGTHISTKHCLAVKRTRPAIAKDKRNDMDTSSHKRLKNSTEKALNQLNRVEKGINKNGLSTSKHVQRFFSKSDELRWKCTSISDQLGHDSNIWKRTLCPTNEEDKVQIEVEEDEDMAAWRSESHLVHDTEPECTPNQSPTAEARATEMEKDTGGVSHISEDEAMTVNTCDVDVENHSVPLSGSKVAEHGRSDVFTDPHKNSTAERIMRKFIRGMNTFDHKRDDSYEYQSSPQASNDSSAVPNSTSSPDPVLDEGMSNNYNMVLDSDVDPIPIPGPPGSFLPSPGNAETEDYRGNSSLTASLSSSHYEQDNGNSSKSPTSSASNLAVETTAKITEKLPSTGADANPDSLLLGFPIPQSEVSMVETSLFPPAIKFGSTRSEYVDQKSYMKLQDENQPCCCSRKERVQRGSVVDYQESQLLRRRTISATLLPIKENISCSLNTAPNYSSAGTDIYSLSSSSFRAVDIPALKAPATPKYQDTMNANKFHANVDPESASPSAVLRLMGKNLMVAKNDEGLTGPSRDDTACPPKPPNMRSYGSPFQRVVPPEPAMNTPSYSSNLRHTFDFRMPTGEDLGGISILQDQEQPTIFKQNYMITNGQCNISPQTMGLGMMPDYMLRVRDHPPSSVNFRKLGTEAGACRNGATVSNCFNYSGTSSMTVYPPALLPSTPIYMQQVPGNTCFPVPFSSSGRSLNPLQVNNYYTQNGSYVLHGGGGGGPFMASPLSTSTLPKPGVFYSPKLP